jgi:hypothetical protein
MAERAITTRRAASLLAPPLALMGLIFVLSAQPGGGDHGAFTVVLRKLAHVTEYAVLTLLWARALGGLGVFADPRAAVAAAALLSLGYAATDEFHQTFVEDRTGTPVDVLIDSVGIAIASLWLLRRPRYAGAVPRGSPGAVSAATRSPARESSSQLR